MDCVSAELTLRHPNYDFLTLWCVFGSCMSYTPRSVTGSALSASEWTWIVTFFFPAPVFRCSCSGSVPLPILRRCSSHPAGFLLLTPRRASPLSAVRKIFKWDGESVENSVFLHYRLLGLCLFQGNWTGMIWDLLREKCSLIGSKGLLYMVGPVDELCFLTLLKQAQMVSHRLVFELPTITEAQCDIIQMSG